MRLGLLNAQAKQDLIIYVLANDKRYEVANYPNVFIPTNIDVKDETRRSFGSFYATLFDAALQKAGGRGVVTEYSWQSTSCDPCPVPPLDVNAIATLGGDVLLNMGATPPPVVGQDETVAWRIADGHSWGGAWRATLARGRFFRNGLAYGANAIAY